MAASLPQDIDQYGIILYTCLFNSGTTLMPVGYTDITPEEARPVQSAVWKPPNRAKSVLTLLMFGSVRVREDELE